jgi:Ca2+-binding RTX toxin-like protein
LIDLSGGSTGGTGSGGGGDDVVLGGGGNDTISGGSGSDQLAGGGGANEFDYTSLGDWAVDGMDTITDFSGNTTVLANAPSTDSINGDVLSFSYAALASFASAVMDGFTHPSPDHCSTLAAGELSALTNGQADQAHAQFVYDAATGIVGFDPDGIGAAAVQQVTLIGTHPAEMALTDFVIVG